MRQAYDYWQNQPGNYLDQDTRRRLEPTEMGRAVHCSRGEARSPGAHRARQSCPRTRGGLSHALTTGLGERGYTRGPVVIQLPPLSSPQAGPRHTSSKAEALSVGVACSPQEEDTVHLSRPEDGYRLWLTPKCLRINVGHRPVIHRLHPSLPTEVDRSSGAGAGHQVLRWWRLHPQSDPLEVPSSWVPITLA